ncbi:site-specific integrase [Enterobacter hormaechei]|uniref:site-specific integrase n=1 Tax=Enterobacter hormaechei TaxID=158836 RepID=UPI003D011CF2
MAHRFHTGAGGKTVREWSDRTNMPFLTTHTFRHLRLTHLARAGWKLHEIATYAGHRDLRTTQIYNPSFRH